MPNRTGKSEPQTGKKNDSPPAPESAKHKPSEPWTRFWLRFEPSDSFRTAVRTRCEPRHLCSPTCNICNESFMSTQSHDLADPPMSEMSNCPSNSTVARATSWPSLARASLGVSHFKDATISLIGAGLTLVEEWGCAKRILGDFRLEAKTFITWQKQGRQPAGPISLDPPRASVQNGVPDVPHGF